jgi:hypothetical protein
MTLAALAVLLPCAAMANALGTIPVGRTGVTGTIHAGETQTWTVRLRRGKAYALGAAECSSGAHATVVLRAPGGKPLVSAATYCDPDGGELRAPADGWYTVTISGDQAQPPDQDQDYTLVVDGDCPGNATSACGIGVGRTLRSLDQTYALDHDWFGVRLAAGRTYLATMTGAGSELLAHDRHGRAIPATAGRDDAGNATLTFRVPADGWYYLDAFGDGGDGTGPYDLSLSLARGP